jgi:hypothetical protein
MQLKTAINPDSAIKRLKSNYEDVALSKDQKGSGT